MTTQGWFQILIFVALIAAITKPLGIFMFHVFEGPQPLAGTFGRLERWLLRACGVQAERGADVARVRGRAAALQRAGRARHLRHPARAGTCCR